MTAPRESAPVRATRIGADVVRVLALLSVVAGIFIFGIGGGLRFALVFVFLLAPRLAGGIPAPFDLAYCSMILLGTWSVTSEWETAVEWLDWPIHGIATGTIAAMLYLLLARYDTFPGLRDRPLSSRPSAIVLLTVSLGFTAGSLWEIYEWFANSVFGAGMRVSYDDTIVDMLMDAAGSLLAGLGLLAWKTLHHVVAARRGKGVAHAYPHGHG